MKTKKNWFSYLGIILFLFGILYILVCGLSELGTGSEYPWFTQGMVLIMIIFAFLAVHFGAILGARWKIERWYPDHEKFWNLAEWIFAGMVLVLSLVIRLYYLRVMPMTPESDYKTYYEIAQLLNKGTLIEEGVGYCDYVAVFPHVLGYSFVLSVVLRIFGTSVAVGQYFNVALAVLTCFVVWRIARILCGRISALAALALVSFWPSQILYNNFLAAEYLFSFLLFTCAWLFLHLVTAYRVGESSMGECLVLHIVLGVLLAATSAIRPMGLILLISIFICLVTARMPIAIKPKNDLPLADRAMEKGWLRALIIIGTYLLVSSFFTKCVSFTVDRELAGGSASMGYNLLVGLNEESYGGWNDEDSDYLYAAIDQTGDAGQAQVMCRDLALQRLKRPVNALLNLFLHKYDVLWSNDDYGTTWNLIFLEEHNQLTSARENFLYTMKDINNIWYFICIFFSGMTGLFLLKGKPSWAYIFVYLFLGTVAMHLLVENQNRYHFHVLYVFVILASYALHEIYEDSKYRIVLANRMGQQKKEWKQQEKEALQRIVEAQEYARQQREDSMSGYFDMGKALRDGNIQMSVSAAYGDDKKPEENNDGKNREEDGEEKKQEENGEVSSHETDTTE
jgi:hypothetical protein